MLGHELRSSFRHPDRGPFPTGTACDAGVEAHLSVCSGCHRLAEALRPALELFQEAVVPKEGARPAGLSGAR